MLASVVLCKWQNWNCLDVIKRISCFFPHQVVSSNENYFFLKGNKEEIWAFFPLTLSESVSHNLSVLTGPECGLAGGRLPSVQHVADRSSIIQTAWALGPHSPELKHFLWVLMSPVQPSAFYMKCLILSLQEAKWGRNYHDSHERNWLKIQRLSGSRRVIWTLGSWVQSTPSQHSSTLLCG